MLYSGGFGEDDEATISDINVEEGAYTDRTTVNESKELSSAEGIFVTAVRCESEDCYDFYIRTCWTNPNGNGVTTIATTVRLQAYEGAEMTPTNPITAEDEDTEIILRVKVCRNS